ncbi:MAG: DUF58 domain-containing protein [Bacteroidetes bacterium]|nr:DUF58 domain-containing protein [Bacteroidota bacterium]
METKKLLAKIKKLEIKTKHHTRQVLSGEYHSAFKGRGMTFSEVRNYQVGDEIRTIDWNVTARFNEPYVKVFEEERELQVFLLIDVSKSSNFGLYHQSKKETILELAATLAFSADSNRDRIGAVFYSDRVERIFPLSKGRKHNLFLLRELINHSNSAESTKLSEAAETFLKVVKRRAIVFVISDFIDDTYSEAMLKMSKKHEVVAIKVEDSVEQSFPKLGLIPLENKESGAIEWVNTSSEKFQTNYRNQKIKEKESWSRALLKMGIDHTVVTTNEDSHLQLVELFHKRLRKV